MEAAPPAYNVPPPDGDRRVDETDLPPPNYSVPTSFTVGGSQIEAPFVSVPEIKGHLALLRAFAELKNRVEASDIIELPEVSLEKEKRWGWFVGIAVERFDIWCQGLRPYDSSSQTETVMPPLDVIMVWHAYMLNPRWYAEDCVRNPACKLLKEFEKHFTQCMQDQFQILSGPPSKSRIDFWKTRTALPFEYSVDGVGAMTKKTIICPKCSTPATVDLVNGTGTGYLQQQFSIACPLPCSQATITMEKLTVQKLARDLAGPISDPLPGTIVHPPSSSDAAEQSRRIRNKMTNIVKALGHNKFEQYSNGTAKYSLALSLAIMDSARFSMDKLRTAMGPPTQLLSKLMVAYGSDKEYSAELVGAVLRQSTFVRKMFDLGWTRPNFFDTQIDELALQHALARYHAFLDLMASSPASFFVPTLDIDLVWHTHQLMASKYELDCNRYIHRFIDHDDKVDGLKLSSAFDITCRAWKSRFNIDYTHCGCPITGDSIGKRLSRLIGMHLTRPAPSHLLPFERPDLLSGTHPSDHNAVLFMPEDERKHQIMKARYTYLKLEKERAVKKKAKKDAKEKAKANVEGKRLSQPHAYTYSDGYIGDRKKGSSDPYYPYMYGAFLLPVPMYYGVGMAGGGGCVPGDGHEVRAGGSGGCGGGCGGGGCSSGGGGGCGGGSGANCSGGDSGGSGGGGCGGGCGGCGG